MTFIHPLEHLETMRVQLEKLPSSMDKATALNGCVAVEAMLRAYTRDRGRRLRVFVSGLILGALAAFLITQLYSSATTPLTKEEQCRIEAGQASASMMRELQFKVCMER